MKLLKFCEIYIYKEFLIPKKYKTDKNKTSWLNEITNQCTSNSNRTLIKIYSTH